MLIKKLNEIFNSKQKCNLVEQTRSMTLSISLGLMVLFFGLFIVYLNQHQRLPFLYLLFSMIMLAFSGIAYLLVTSDLKKPHYDQIVTLFPIVVVTIASMSFYWGIDYFTERIVFYVLILSVSFVSIKSYRYSGLLYLYTMILSLVVILFKQGFDVNLMIAMFGIILFSAAINVLFTMMLSQTHAAYEKEKAANEKLKRSYYELEYTKNIADMMMGITSDILDNEDIESLLNIIIHKAVEVIPNATAGTILLKEDDYMKYAATCGYDQESLRKIRFKYTDTFQYQTGNFQKPEIIQDTESFNKLKASKEFLDQLNRHNIPHSLSVITCPIMIDDEIYGSINLDNLEQEKAFKETDKPIVQYLAEQISLALKNQILLNKTLYYTKHDMLTDAYSRIYHEELLSKTYETSKESNKPFCLAIIDINNMKKINDTWGHQAGDKVLIAFTKMTKEKLKDNHSLSRFGGDEFAIIFENTDQPNAKRMIESLRTFFQKTEINLDDESIFLDFGMGIACYPTDEKELSALMTIADKRMYEDKEHRKQVKIKTD